MAFGFLFRALLVVAGLVLLGVIIYCFCTIIEKIKTTRFLKRADKLIQAGKWEEAVAEFRKAILVNLFNKKKLPALICRLDDLLKSHDVVLDFSKIKECPKLFQEIMDGDLPAKEKGELIGKLYKEANLFLIDLPI